MMVRLPVPPSTNNLYANGKRGRYITAGYEAWLTRAGLALKQHPIVAFGQMLVQVKIYLPRKSKMDIDNGSKAVLDLLQKHGVYRNDRQVERLTIERHDENDALVGVTPYSEAA